MFWKTISREDQSNVEQSLSWGYHFNAFTAVLLEIFQWFLEVDVYSSVWLKSSDFRGIPCIYKFSKWTSSLYVQLVHNINKFIVAQVHGINKFLISPN